MGLGMTLVMFALQGGQAGIVATLSTTSPALVLPMLCDDNEKNTTFMVMGRRVFVSYWLRLNF